MLTIESTDTFSTIFLGDIARIITFFGAVPELKKMGGNLRLRTRSSHDKA